MDSLTSRSRLVKAWLKLVRRDQDLQRQRIGLKHAELRLKYIVFPVIVVAWKIIDSLISLAG